MPKSKNVTFNLPQELKDKYKCPMRIEKEILKQEMMEASKDPMFMKDLNESINAFETIEADTDLEDEEW